MRIIIILVLLGILMVACSSQQPLYTDASCGSLCIQKECRKDNDDCGINVYGEIKWIGSKEAEYCLDYCREYIGNNT